MLTILVTEPFAAELIWFTCEQFAMKMEENARWTQKWLVLLYAIDTAIFSISKNTSTMSSDYLFFPTYQHLLLWSFMYYLCILRVGVLHFTNKSPVILYLFPEINKSFFFCLVVRSGDYYLFETDSEEEEEEELNKEDEEPPRKSAFQVIMRLRKLCALLVEEIFFF